ncbi:hypothetical protein [Reichenbachiella sp.]|uniref:hypothetical protein n=1 Tax=Reichenbachiella sp. TaxID=2184521 RepID=UPI003298FAE4
MTLILPVAFYLFLQGFGKNQFAIPIYFESGIVAPLDGCPPSVSKQPYQLDQETLVELMGEGAPLEDITVYELGNSTSDHFRNNLYTFLEKYKDEDDVKLVSIKELKDTVFAPSRYGAWQRFNLADSNLMRLGRCILQLDLNPQMKTDSGLVLVDKKQQIRGYYDPMILKEIDRLNTELYILLSDQN